MTANEFKPIPGESHDDGAHVCSKCGGADESATPAKDEKKKHPFTWERSIEIAKVLATVWVALIGSWVTMQFNERQHELNRIEAIAKMLPHMSSSAPPGNSSDADESADSAVGNGGGSAKLASGSATGGTSAKAPSPNKIKTASTITEPTQDMSRQGAIWAIFRTAQNRAMLRDLAALFPADIYSVVSSIAVAGGLEQDPDALTALQITSEKLATEYSADPKRAELASRLYAQALKLKERSPDDPTPIHVVDLTSANVDMSGAEDQVYLVRMVNNLAEAHIKEGQTRSIGSSTSQAKQLFTRAIELARGSDDPDIQLQLMRSQLGLAEIYLSEKRLDLALRFLKDEEASAAQQNGTTATTASAQSLDKDNDGFATAEELEGAIAQQRQDLNTRLANQKNRGVRITAVKPAVKPPVAPHP